MNVIEYRILGDPTPLARPRIGGRYAKRHVFDPQQRIKFVQCESLKEQHGNNPQYEGPLILNAIFFFPISDRNKKKIGPGAPHKQVPDISNLIKFIEDISQQSGLLKNDCLIYAINAEKRYGIEPMTIFSYREQR